MKFQFIDTAKESFPVTRLCQVLEVSPSGYFAWRSRPASPRQREDLVLLAHIRSAFARSHGTYGSPRLTRELQDEGLEVGRRRTARLMRENGLRARQKRRFKRTTDSHHSFPSLPICSTGLLGGAPEPEMGRRYLVRVDERGLALSGRGPGSLRSAGGRLGRQ
jgi:putative transposase